MPFFGKKSDAKEMSRKKLEYQLYLAKHGPDNVVDLSSCDLKHVPSGTYALCKVLLKEVLILHSNYLKDLKEDGTYEDLSKLMNLRVFDVCHNQLFELPPNIDRLTSLQVLNIQQNKLKSLPEVVCRLRSLQTLNLKDNELSQLPERIGDLSSLRILDISGNRIKSLPKSLCRARCLETVAVDVDEMIYPPKEICKAGTADMMKFLCVDLGIEYLPSSHAILSLMNKPDVAFVEPFSDVSVVSTARTRSLGAKADFERLAIDATAYEELKERRRNEFVRLEADLFESRKRQMELLESMSVGRRNLLRAVEKEQTDSETKFHSLQESRDTERKRFLLYLNEMEEHTNALMARLLDMNARAKKTENVLEREERARQIEEGLFKIRMDEYERLRKREIERAMEMNACQYFSLEQLREMQESKRDHIAERAKFEDTVTNENLQLVLQRRDLQMRELLSELIAEESFQKEALLALMVQRDARSNRLNRQIEFIQRQLTHLSSLELKNKQRREADVMARLREQRETLCAMMMQLLDEKAQRSKELQKRLIEMEKARLQDQVDFWLIQYQRLLDTKPDALIAAERELDMSIMKILNAARAEEYAPAFARHSVTPESMLELTEEDLQRMGMYEVGLRKTVLQMIEGYEAEKKHISRASNARTFPSPTTPVSPSETVLARFEMECVVCMSEDCGLVFLPCGHVCCCRACGERVAECPLCRTRVDQKVDLRAGIL